MSPQQKVILLVDDDEHDAFFMQRALQKAKIDSPLYVVEDGEQALEYLDGRGKFADRAIYPLPFLMFLDLKLPYLSGFQVLEHIRRQPSLGALQVVVLTSSSEDRDRRRVLELGAAAYLVKPPDETVLLQIVGSLSPD